MDIKGKIIVVTGAASGIGAGLVKAFSQHGAKAVIATDADDTSLAKPFNSLSMVDKHVLDVTDAKAVGALIDNVEKVVGPIDLFCANAGIAGPEGFLSIDDASWDRVMKVNFMSHVYSTRHLLPLMIKRRKGHFLHTVSAAGLLTDVNQCCYSVSKHAAYALIEWLAIQYGGSGIGFSVLCPQFVQTGMTSQFNQNQIKWADKLLTPEEVAQTVITDLANNKFLILPHPEVEKFFQNKAKDIDTWIGKMRRFL